MARISIKFLANIKKIVGRESLEMDIGDEETLEHVLCYLSEKFGKRLRKVFFEENGFLSEKVVIFVNGKNVMTGKGLKTKVNDGDRLIIFTPVAGG